MYYEVFLMLSKLGISTGSHGYWYFKEAVDIVDKDRERLLYICDGVYSEIAVRFHTSWDAVERSMRHSITKAWESGRIAIGVKDLTGSEISWNGKPSNREFITLLVENLWSRREKRKEN